MPAWDSSRPATASLPAYDALHDQNLRAHYEKRGVRRQLLEGSLIDRVGRILRENSTKLNIIEQEFRNAERDEQRRLHDEEYERRKLDSRKKYMRVHQTRILQCKERREQSLARRQEYATRYYSFLPAGNGSLAGGAKISEGPRSKAVEQAMSAASSASADGRRQPEKRPSTKKPTRRASSTAQSAAITGKRSPSVSSSGSERQAGGRPASAGSRSSSRTRSSSRSGSREEEERAQSEEEAASEEESEDYDDDA